MSQKIRSEFSSYSIYIQKIKCRTEHCTNLISDNSKNNRKVFCDVCQNAKRNSRANEYYAKRKLAKKLSWVPNNLYNKIINIET